MKSTTGCRRLITLSLMGILSAVVGTGPAHSQTAVVPGSVGSHSGGSQETLIPPKPRDSHADAKRSMRPPDVPDQTTTPNMRARILEERLRSGRQIERPIAQSQVSDWLDQLHSGSGERSTDDTAPGQSAQGIVPD
jgi:hypothetical protein